MPGVYQQGTLLALVQTPEMRRRDVKPGSADLGVRYTAQVRWSMLSTRSGSLRMWSPRDNPCRLTSNSKVSGL